MAAQIFCRRMHDHVCTMFERAGLHRGRIGIVDHRLRAMALSDCAHRSNIDQAHIRIGWRFEIDDFGLVRDRGFQGQRIGEINMPNRDSEAAEPMLEEREGAAIQRLISDQFIAGAQEAPQDRRDRAHAGGHGHRRFAAFQ